MHGKSAYAGTGVVTLTLLGRFGLEHDGARVELSVTGQRLLALLALTGSISRSTAAGALWPDVTEGRAHSSLRTTLWRLHRSGRIPVECHGDRLALAADVAVDTTRFAECARRLLHAPAPTELAADEESALAAVILSADELLPGWDEEWVTFEREQVRQLRLHALETLSYRFLASGAHADALGAAMEAVRLDPLRESPHRAVVAVHLSEGNLIEAMRHYAGFRQSLLDELGTEPSPLFRDMVSAIEVDRHREPRLLPDVTERRIRVAGQSSAAVFRLRPHPARP